ncbi:MAG: dockerin type I repeat-containing protein, partial [Clostridia bacterium]|nr:dockerin type I repeat-containing protein [Clostridia bacterium]
VTNLDKLIALANAMNALKANEVIGAIDALPDPANVTNAYREQINTVVGLYNALDKEQKDLVTNKDKLDAVVAALEAISGVIYGDVDGNGVVAAADALEILKSVVGKISLTDTQVLAADVDGNKVVAAADALMILQKVVGKIQLFPVEQ